LFIIEGRRKISESHNSEVILPGKGSRFLRRKRGIKIIGEGRASEGEERFFASSF